MFDIVHGAVVGLVLLTVTLPLAGRAAEREKEPRLRSIITWGLVLKLAMAPVYLFVIATFYDDIADFNIYHRNGAALADTIRSGVFDFDVVDGSSGSRFISIVTGFVYAAIGESKLGAFFVFAWFGFLGHYFFYRAFRTALPSADHVRYAALVFLLPSLLFWTSVIGKDAWMVMSLGLAALGAARVFRRMPSGYLLAVLGVFTGSLVRPHVMFLMAGAAGIGYAVRRAHRPSPLGPMVRIAGIVTIVLAAGLLVGSVERFTGVDDLSLASVNERLDEIEGRHQNTERNAGSGSTFDPGNPRTLASYPLAVVTVLFRPFPFEASGIPALVASLEGLMLLVLFVASARHWWAALRASLRDGYLLMVVVYAAGFVYLFSSFSNFGLLARQRVQLLPLLLVLLAYDTARRSVDHRAPHDGAVAGSARARPVSLWER